MLDIMWYCMLIPVLILILLGAFTRNQRKELFRRADAECEKCNNSWADGHMLEADHIIALSDGGSNELENGQFLCVPCHAQKHEESSYEAKKAGDIKGERSHAWAARQIRKRSIWRR